MNFSSKSITSAFLVIIVIAFGYFVVMPRWTAYTEVKILLEEKQEQKKSLERAQEQLTAFIDEYKQHSVDASTLNMALPLNQPQLYNILNSLETLTRESGISLAGLNFSNTLETDTLGAEVSAIQPVDVSVSGSGTYTSFKQFLSRLEENLRIIDVKSVTLANDEGNTATYGIKFRTYYQK